MARSRCNPEDNRLSRRAMVLVKDPDFGFYLDWFRTKKSGTKTPYGTHNEEDRKEAVQNACGIKDLSELDQYDAHAPMFWRINREFRQWQVDQARKYEARRR